MERIETEGSSFKITRTYGNDTTEVVGSKESLSIFIIENSIIVSNNGSVVLKQGISKIMYNGQEVENLVMPSGDFSVICCSQEEYDSVGDKEQNTPYFIA